LHDFIFDIFVVTPVLTLPSPCNLLFVSIVFRCNTSLHSDKLVWKRYCGAGWILSQLCFIWGAINSLSWDVGFCFIWGAINSLSWDVGFCLTVRGTTQEYL
jgi:hypothetical protein